MSPGLRLGSGDTGKRGTSRDNSVDARRGIGITAIALNIAIAGTWFLGMVAHLSVIYRGFDFDFSDSVGKKSRDSADRMKLYVLTLCPSTRRVVFAFPV